VTGDNNEDVCDVLDEEVLEDALDLLLLLRGTSPTKRPTRGLTGGEIGPG